MGYNDSYIDEDRKRKENFYGLSSIWQKYAAEAFKALCDEAGIHSYFVLGIGNGGNHQWNIVQLDDGNWYEVDVTWKDSLSSKRYFCITSEKMAEVHERTMDLMHGYESIVPVTKQNRE